MSKQFDVGGIRMELPIISGAGVVKNPSKVEGWLDPNISIGACISGTYTLEPREGNDGNLVYPADIGEIEQRSFALNAYGMPNIGLSAVLERLPSISTQEKNPHILSIAGFQTSDYTHMIDMVKENGYIAGIELNCGCPNTGHMPLAYSLEDLYNLLEQINQVNFEKPFWLKLSPYLTAEMRNDISKKLPHLNFSVTPTVDEAFVKTLCDEVLTEYSGMIQAVVISNTIPNVSYGTAITVKGNDSMHHTGGLSGPVLRPYNIAIIKKMIATGIGREIDIIGCGGITHGDHVLEYLHAGCAGVQCTTGPAWVGPRFFSQLLQSSDGLLEYLS